MPHYKRGVANCKSVKVNFLFFYFYKFYGHYAASILKFQKTHPFMVLGQITGNSNVGHKLTEIMAKIWAAINLAQDPQWSIPMANLLPEAMTPTY